MYTLAILCPPLNIRLKVEFVLNTILFLIDGAVVFTLFKSMLKSVISQQIQHKVTGEE